MSPIELPSQALPQLANRATRIEQQGRSLAACVALCGACLMTGCTTMHVPVLKFHPVDHPKMPDPVFSGPGGVGPIFNPPTIVSGTGCCQSSCNGCPPSRPVQPVDPFGWIKSGSQGSQIVDPIGWAIGL